MNDTRRNELRKAFDKEFIPSFRIADAPLRHKEMLYDVFDWFMDNLPKEEVKQEPVGWRMRPNGYTIYSKSEKQDILKASSIPVSESDFEAVYTHPVKEDKWIEEIQADIRNKLSPIANLIAILKKSDSNSLVVVGHVFRDEINRSSESIKYLSDFLTLPEPPKI